MGLMNMGFIDELNEYRDPNIVAQEEQQRKERSPLNMIMRTAFGMLTQMQQARETAAMINMNNNELDADKEQMAEVEQVGNDTVSQERLEADIQRLMQSVLDDRPHLNEFDDEEETEEDEPQSGGGKKRTASTSLEAESPKKGKTPLPEESTAASDSSPEWDPRAQPLVNS